ncbi:MAG: tetratricopeptide repeat protein [Gammaproteobacteria bacterium]|nr:MAG: tetratricopeptide repeat protein [Gammaproteobacteria bacterium]
MNATRIIGLCALTTLLLAGCSAPAPRSGGEQAAPPPAAPQPPAASEETGEEQREGLILFELLAGELAGREGDLATAAQAYAEAAWETRDPDVAERATRIALYAGQLQLALRSANRWAQLQPDNIEAHQVLGVLYARMGQVDTAVHHLQRVIESGEDVEGGYRLVGGLLSQQIPAEHALEVMRGLVALHPDRHEAWQSLAALAMKLKRPDAALPAVEKALELDSESVESRLLHAQVLLELGQKERALDEARRLVDEHPGRNDIRLALAQMLVQSGEYERARQRFEQVLTRQPDNADLVYTLALLNLEMKRYKDARRYLERVLSMGKHVYDASYYLGRIAEQEGDFRQAASWYLRVTDGPYQREAQARVAVMLARLGRVEEAREHLRRMRQQAATADEQVQLYLMEGEILIEAGRLQEARKLYQDALKTFPDNPDLLYGLAMLAEQEGDLETMERLLKQLLARNPEDARALNALGYVLADRTERYMEALGFIRRALEISPDDPAILDSMGWVLYRLGKPEEALKYLQRAHKKLLDDEIGSHLAEVLWKLGRKKEARQVLEQVKKAFPDSEVVRRTERLIGP